MVCIYCGSKTQVINSRSQKRNNQVWRRRKCVECQAIFTTEESATYDGSWLIQLKNGRHVAFSRDKLFMSLYESCRHRPTAVQDAGDLTDTVIKKLAPQVANGVVDMKSVAQVSQVALNRFDLVASTHYQAFHKQ